MQSQQLRYTNVAIALHWIIAILMVYMLFLGEGLIKNVQGTYYPSIHASLGLSILILSVARLGWRLINAPPPDVPMPQWQAKASNATHWLFYALMILLPLSGMADLDRRISRVPELANLTFFGAFPIPHFSLTWFGQLHDVGSKIGIALLLIHVAGALKHQFIDKDNLLRRMSPH